MELGIALIERGNLTAADFFFYYVVVLVIKGPEIKQ
jgi:hypothetical protein